MDLKLITLPVNVFMVVSKNQFHNIPSTETLYTFIDGLPLKVLDWDVNLRLILQNSIDDVTYVYIQTALC